MLALKVSENGRFVEKENGEPFFYLADTAWQLVPRCTREEADMYLEKRASQGFTAIMTLATIGDKTSLFKPNRYGQSAFVDDNPEKPVVGVGKDGYWNHVDYIINKAESLELYVSLLPIWGRDAVRSKKSLNDTNAYAYGLFLGTRYRDKKNIIWVMGGDTAPDGFETVWRTLAKGIADGVNGNTDFSNLLFMYHIWGDGKSLEMRSSGYFLHNEAWLDCNGTQSGHIKDLPAWRLIEQDYARMPVKPVSDLEPIYVNMPYTILNSKGEWQPDTRESIDKIADRAKAYDARRGIYWSLFAGGFGVTYGYNEVWQFYSPLFARRYHADTVWQDALDDESAAQMGFVRRLVESRPILERIPDQSILLTGNDEGPGHVQATRARDGSYAFVYIPVCRSVMLDMAKFSGEMECRWFDPRSGTLHPGTAAFCRCPNSGTREFTTPETGPDWVLLLDDCTRGYPCP